MQLLAMNQSAYQERVTESKISPVFLVIMMMISIHSNREYFDAVIT